MSFDAAIHQFPGAAAATAARKQQDIASCCHERQLLRPARDAAAATSSVTQPDTSSDDAAASTNPSCYERQSFHPVHDAATSSVTPPDTNSGHEWCSPNSTRNAAATTNPRCYKRQSLCPAHDAAADSLTQPDASSDYKEQCSPILHPAHDAAAATGYVTQPDASSDDAAASTNPSCYERQSFHPAHDAATSSVTPPDTNSGHERCSPNSTGNAAARHASTALLEANQRLLTAQAQIKKERLSEQWGIAVATRLNQGQPAAGEIEDAPFTTGKEDPSGLTHETSSSAAAIIAALPEHLGWESATVSALLALS